MDYLTKKSSCIVIIMISIIFCATVVSAYDAETPAVSKCRELVSQGDYFVDNENDGPTNFIYAFQNLSSEQIDNKFNRMNPKRGLQHDLTKMYFSNLFVNHGLDLSHLKTPAQWCAEIFTQVPLDLEVYSNDDERETDCLGFTRSMFVDDTEQHDPKLIFERFYNYWSYIELEKVTTEVVLSLTSEEVEDVQRDHLERRLRFCFKNYSLPYFQHYEGILNNIDPTNFKSIKIFCEDIGHLIVTENT